MQEGDWILIYDNSLDNQHSALKKFSKHWFGPYMVVHVLDNATYALKELDETRFKIPVARKYINFFKQQKHKLVLEDVEEEFDLCKYGEEELDFEEDIIEEVI